MPSNKGEKMGGLRLPSLEVLEHHLALTGDDATRKAILLRNRKPRKIKIYQKDLKRLTEIGGGRWRDGFYRALALAEHIWLDRKEIRIIKETTGCDDLREAIFTLLEAYRTNNHKEM